MVSSDKQDPPASELVFTGERFVPRQGDPLLALEHYHRYCLASRFVNGKRVLDIACGEGYGSAFLSKWAGEVVGVDNDDATIAHAREKYGSMHNLRFEVGDCRQTREAQESFDVIVSFETIEHLDGNDQAPFLETVRRSLRQNGLFIVSSPERTEYGATVQGGNQYHRHEMTLPELKAFLGAYFRHVHICAQRVLSLSTAWRLDGWRDARFRFNARKNLTEDIPAGESFSPPLYLIAICSDMPLADGILEECNSFYFDMTNIEESKRLFEWTQKLNEEAQKNREVILHLQKQFDERTAWALSLEDRIKDRDAIIDAKGKELEERTRWAHSLDAEIAKERAYGKQVSEKLTLITASFFYRALARLKLIPR